MILTNTHMDRKNVWGDCRLANSNMDFLGERFDYLGQRLKNPIAGIYTLCSRSIRYSSFSRAVVGNVDGGASWSCECRLRGSLLAWPTVLRVRGLGVWLFGLKRVSLHLQAFFKQRLCHGKPPKTQVLSTEPQCENPTPSNPEAQSLKSKVC